MSLGIPEGKLIMVDYDPSWKKYGEETAQQLKNIVKKAADIQHIGSSSVEGMYGKPLIDIAIGVRSLDDILEYVDELEKNGYQYLGEFVEGQREFILHDPETGCRTHNIHCVLYQSKNWNDYVNLRDYLNTHENARTAYSMLKKALVMVYADRPSHYGPAKHIFMEDMLLDVAQWANEHPDHQDNN